MKKNLFCANCQTTIEHDFTVVRTPVGDELISTCDCGRQLKLPTEPEALKTFIEAHGVANLGQVPALELLIPDDHPALKALAEL